MKNNTLLNRILNKIISIAAKLWEAVELLFKKKSGIKILSLIITISLFLFVKGETGFNLFAAKSKSFANLQVVSKMNNEDLVALGLENIKVMATIEADYSSLNLITNDSQIVPFVDLTKLSDGVHNVPVQVDETKLPEGVKVILNPRTVNVKIAKKITASKQIEIDLRNETAKNSKLVIVSKNTNQSVITVRGAAEDLTKVSVVKVEVDVANIVSLGEVILLSDHFRTVAYDLSGNEVKNIEILDEDLQVTLNVESPSKELSFNYSLKGKPENGFAVASISTNPTTNVVYGPQVELDKLLFFPIVVDVTNLNQNKVETIDLKIPAGATAMDIKLAKLTITIEKEISKNYINNSDGTPFVINKINDPQKFNSSLAEGALKDLEITLTGAQSLIDNFDTSQLKITVDMSNLQQGVNNLPLKIETNNPFIIGKANKNTIEVVAENR